MKLFFAVMSLIGLRLDFGYNFILVQGLQIPSKVKLRYIYQNEKKKERKRKRENTYLSIPRCTAHSHMTDTVANARHQSL